MNDIPEMVIRAFNGCIGYEKPSCLSCPYVLEANCDFKLVKDLEALIKTGDITIDSILEGKLIFKEAAHD